MTRWADELTAGPLKRGAECYAQAEAVPSAKKSYAVRAKFGSTKAFAGSKAWKECDREETQARTRVYVRDSEARPRRIASLPGGQV